jgi:hypothetical protein
LGMLSTRDKTRKRITDFTAARTGIRASLVQAAHAPAASLTDS